MHVPAPKDKTTRRRSVAQKAIGYTERLMGELWMNYAPFDGKEINLNIKWVSILKYKKSSKALASLKESPPSDKCS